MTDWLIAIAIVVGVPLIKFVGLIFVCGLAMNLVLEVLRDCGKAWRGERR